VLCLVHGGLDISRRVQGRVDEAPRRGNVPRLARQPAQPARGCVLLLRR
jgi:hypothetical protein